MRSRREGEAPAEPQWLGSSLALPITNHFNALAISEECQLFEDIPPGSFRKRHVKLLKWLTVLKVELPDHLILLKLTDEFAV